MNCMLDLFDKDFTPPPKSWFLVAGEYAVRLPLLAGYLAGAVAWKTAQVGGNVALAGIRLALTSKAHPAPAITLTAEEFEGAWEIVDGPNKPSGAAAVKKVA